MATKKIEVYTSGHQAPLDISHMRALLKYPMAATLVVHESDKHERVFTESEVRAMVLEIATTASLIQLTRSNVLRLGERHGVSPDPQQHPRPSTRDELLRLMQAGTTCEVAGHVAEITDTMLRGWLQYDGFTMNPSPNAGWVLFIPTQGA